MGFLPHNPASEREHRWMLAGLIAAGALLIAAAVFTSPWVLLGGVVFLAFVYLTFREPMWTILFLTVWWPVEPFVLKFLSDDIYVYARYFSELLVYVLVVAVIVGVLSFKYKQRVTPVDVPFVLFLIVLITSVVLNVLPVTDALLGARQILRFVLLFFVVVMRYPRRYWIKRLAVALMVMMALQAGLGILQAVTGGALDSFLLPSERRTVGELQLTEGTIQFWDPGQRVFGTLGRYDRLGAFIALVLLLALGFLYESNRKQGWSHLWLLAAIGIPALVLTYSRSAWFGLVLGAVAIAAVRKDKRTLAVAGIVAVIFAGMITVNGVSTSLSDVPRQTVAERLLEGFSYQRFRGEYLGLGRVYWIVQTPTQIVPHSIVSGLFGWGPGQYGGGAVAALGNTRVYDQTGLPYGVYGTEGYIDNNWFSLWGETGTLGLAFYLWMYIALIVIAVRIARHSKTALTRSVASAFVGIAFAVAVNAGLATFLEIRTLAPYLWMLGGCVVVLGSREHLLATRVRHMSL